jgi:excisionase family DNA binding protein
VAVVCSGNVRREAVVYLAVKQLVERSGLSESTWRRIIKRGEIEWVRIGRSIRVPEPAYLAFMEARTRRRREDDGDGTRSERA